MYKKEKRKEENRFVMKHCIVLLGAQKDKLTK